MKKGLKLTQKAREELDGTKLVNTAYKMLAERHPQLSGLTDDPKWGGKIMLGNKCYECGMNYAIFRQDLYTFLTWIYKEAKGVTAESQEE